jgi:hypothetical protein
LGYDTGWLCMKEELHYMISYDSKGNPLDGGKNYKFHLPACIPASDYWSIIVYDTLTKLIIKSHQPWPSVFSNNKNLLYNQDGSVDAWFGPKYVKGKEGNWVKTMPGKQWYLILRLYYPLESWFNNNWKPGEIEELI